MITAAPTLCSTMNVAASRSVRPGVIVRTCSVIASRTFTAPSDRLCVASSTPRRAGWRDHTQFVPFVASRRPPHADERRRPGVERR